MGYTAGIMNNVRKLWEKCNIAREFPRLAERVRFDEPMTLHTTFRVGGPADFYVEPDSVEELTALLSFFHEESVPVWITGGGSNLVISDHGLRGACVSLAAFRSISLQDTLVSAGAGLPVDELVSWCAERGLSGLEQFAGLPGTVGGAVYMNARCYDRSVSDVFFRAEVLVFHEGRYTVEVVDRKEEEWGYKKSPFQDCGPKPDRGTPPVVLSAVFSVVPADQKTIRDVMDRCVRDREEKGHFRYPSAGSMFKNNRAFGKSSGQIIDEAGLRGFTVGGAQVAPWHGNLIINRGNASAEDIRRLVEQVRTAVYEKTGFLLETEVVFAGEWQRAEKDENL